MRNCLENQLNEDEMLTNIKPINISIFNSSLTNHKIMFSRKTYASSFCAVLLLFFITSCENKSGSTETEADESANTEAMHNGDAEPSTKKPASPRKAAMAMVDGNNVHIDFSSPSTRGRVIFGGLVALNEVWVTGAHKATSIEFDKPVKINGQEIKAGKYGFFTIPGEDTWTIIINTNWDMHLADDYDQAEDILRIEVNPENLDETQETLEYYVESQGEKKGRISFAWDKTKVSFEFSNL